MKSNFKKQFFTASKIIFLALFFLSAKTSFGLTTIINPATSGSFESGSFAGNGWTVVNPSGGIEWYVGLTGTEIGSNGAYISNNGGTNNKAGTGYHVSYFYQDVTIPAGETTITLTFDYRGEGDASDCLQVFMVPTSTAITADNQLYTGQVGGNYYSSSATAWHNISITLPCAYAGTTQRLVFCWLNIGGVATNPAASVDNISLTSVNTGSLPSCASLLGGGVTNVASLPYSSGSGTTCGSTCNLTQSNATICDDANYYTGLANVWVFTPTTSGTVTINLTSSGTYTGLMLYDGCPMGCSSTPGTCVGDAQSTTGNKALTVCLTAGVTYYLVLDSWTAPSCNAYSNLTISAPSGGGSPANDLPCGATAIALGSSVTDNNACATGTGEPSYPSCWTNGSINTLWYSFVAPASGKVNVNATAGTLADIQLVVYSGTCGSLTKVTNSCSYQNQTDCSGFNYYTGADLTGLTPGATYYVEVDGYESETGTYTISAYDGNSTPTPVQAQDCALPNPVCSSQTTVGNPGYSGSGNDCDISATAYCLGEGERNVVWYTIPITTSGDLVFAIVPNDYGNPNPYTGQVNPGYSGTGTETDYDFGIWKVAGSGTLATCATIASGTAPITACNYSYLGVTGCYGTGSAPSNFTGYGGGFANKITATAGDVYLLAVSNFTGSTQGFTLLIGSTLLTGTPSGTDAGVNYTSPTTVTWSGGAGNTDWTNSINWGSCAIPTCGISAVVSPSSTFQPTVAANETVQNLTINAGATLTINAGVTLTVCGDFTNNGTLIASPTSTILFTNPITHNLYGNLTGTNQLGNLTITSSGGTCTVNANVNVDISGNFTTSNATSIFNTMGNYIRVAKNFTNNSAATTYTNVGTTGTLEFYGSAAQTYTPGGSLTLNNVVLNQSAASTVTLSGNNMILGTSGNLTLTQGVIVTNALEVTVNNKATTSVTTGNTTSYVNGNLRRYLNSTGSYDFPVGNTSSYQRANINFTAATSIGNLLARFDTPAPAGPQGSTECSTTYNLADLNNGYWTITANANPTTGTYTTTLYPTAYTNSAGASGWTVIKNDGAAWYLNGTCVTSTVTKVIRNSMNGFSKFAVAQATNPLPIELLSFTGENQGSSNLISWATASETNNAYFTIEHSDDGITFSQVSQVSGAGNSTQEKDYSTVDYNPFSPVTYYRLKQTDFDGNYTYSDVIAIDTKMKDASIGNVRPNPTKDNVAFDVSAPTNGSIEIQVVDMYGKILVDNTKTVTQGQSTFTTNLQDVAPGVYLMKIIFSQNNFSATTHLITSYHKIVKY